MRLGTELLDHCHGDIDRRQPRLRELEIFEVAGADAEDHLAVGGGAVGRTPLAVERQAEAAELDVVFRDRRLDEVHRRRADEGRDEEIDRLVVEHLGLVHLLDRPVAHDRHALPERHRLDLVVGDVDGRHAETLVQARELGAHPDAQLRVEVRERLVHQERGRLAHDRPSHRDPLALAAGESGRPAVEEVLEPEHGRHLVDALPDLALRHLAHLEPEAEVLAHRHVRVQGVVLEHHRDVAIARGGVSDVVFAEQDDAVGHLLEPGDHAQERRLAAARRPDQHHELAARDRQAHVVHGMDITLEHLGHAVQDDLAHGPLPSLSRSVPERAG